MKTYHTTRDGTKIKITEMGDTHLINTIKIFLRRASIGVTVYYGGGIDSDDIWFDSDIIFGKEALELINYMEYKKEADKRWLKI